MSNSLGDRSLWSNKPQLRATSDVDPVPRRFYCSHLDAFVTNRMSCETMSKLSGYKKSGEDEPYGLQCGRNKVIQDKTIHLLKRVRYESNEGFTIWISSIFSATYF